MALRFTLRQLEYLVAVGEAGSIALACARVNVSAPSISAAIAQLEAEFGLALFARKHGHGLTLTHGGRQVMAQARVVLAEAARLGEIAGAVTGRVAGPLSVGCLQSFADVVLPPLRRSFVDLYPAVDFQQQELTQSAIFEGLRRARLDVALCYDLEVPTDLRFVPLRALPPYAVLPPDHPLAARQSVSLADLAPFPMVLLDLPLSSDYFLSAFAACGLRPRIAERTREMGVMRSMVANGFGYSIANIRPAPAMAPDGRPVVHVALEGPLRPLALGLALMAGAGTALTVRAFVSHAQERLAGGEV